MEKLTVTSPAFADGQAIPPRYTGTGPDVSPPLAWSAPPAGTKSLALVCDDPDAPGGTWVHWVLYNLPPDTRTLEENVPKDPRLPRGALQGVTDFRRTGYNGPMPPPGRPHRYRFKVYALDTVLALPPGAAKADLEGAMQGRILAGGTLTGLFQR